MKNWLLLLPVLAFTACHNSDNSTAQKDAVAVKPATEIPAKREQVKTEPVAEFKEKVADELNDWHFAVKVYETEQTFTYKVKLEYQELRAEDSFTLPNLGIAPKIHLKKGEGEHTCIIGYLDKQELFHAYRQVTAKNGKVKITSIP